MRLSKLCKPHSTMAPRFTSLGQSIFGTLLSLAIVLFLSAPVHSREAIKPLVDVRWLHDSLLRPDVFVLDIRSAIGGGTAARYRLGHIPGAVYSNYLNDGWRVEQDGKVGMMPDPADLQALLQRLGVAENNHVIIVSAGLRALDMAAATRVYFTLKYAGHDAVSILDGGYNAWKNTGLIPIESGTFTRPRSNFQVNPRPFMLAHHKDVVRAIDLGIPLIDTRPFQQFEGEDKHKRVVRFGTIKNAVNIAQEFITYNGSGFFQTEEVLRLLWQSAGVSTQDPQIFFDNTGHFASLGWFVASEIFGNDYAQLYDGSLVEWASDPDAPMDHEGRAPILQR